MGMSFLVSKHFLGLFAGTEVNLNEISYVCAVKHQPNGESALACANLWVWVFLLRY